MRHFKDGLVGAGIIPDEEQHRMIDISYCYFLSILRKKEEDFKISTSLTRCFQSTTAIVAFRYFSK